MFFSSLVPTQNLKKAALFRLQHVPAYSKILLGATKNFSHELFIYIGAGLRVRQTNVIPTYWVLLD